MDTNKIYNIYEYIFIIKYITDTYLSIKLNSNLNLVLAILLHSVNLICVTWLNIHLCYTFLEKEVEHCIYKYSPY